MQVRALLFSSMLLALMMFPGDARAHGSDGGGFPSTGAPKESAPDPEDDIAIESSAWFGDHNNEVPEQVDHYLERVEARRGALRRAGAGPEEIASLDVKVRRLQLRKEIATKRQKRDELKRQGAGEALQRVEREIHALKIRFKAVDTASPQATAQHDDHDH